MIVDVIVIVEDSRDHLEVADPAGERICHRLVDVERERLAVGNLAREGALSAVIAFHLALEPSAAGYIQPEIQEMHRSRCSRLPIRTGPERSCPRLTRFL